jgi:hypothetical protein
MIGSPETMSRPKEARQAFSTENATEYTDPLAKQEFSEDDGGDDVPHRTIDDDDFWGDDDPLNNWEQPQDKPEAINPAEATVEITLSADESEDALEAKLGEPWLSAYREMIAAGETSFRQRYEEADQDDKEAYLHLELHTSEAGDTALKYRVILAEKAAEDGSFTSKIRKQDEGEGYDVWDNTLNDGEGGWKDYGEVVQGEMKALYDAMIADGRTTFELADLENTTDEEEAFFEFVFEEDKVISRPLKRPRQKEPEPEAEVDDGWDDAAWEIPDYDLASIDPPQSLSSLELPAIPSALGTLDAQPAIVIEPTQATTATITALEPISNPVAYSSAEVTAPFPESTVQPTTIIEPQPQPPVELASTPPSITESAFQPASSTASEPREFTGPAAPTPALETPVATFPDTPTQPLQPTPAFKSEPVPAMIQPRVALITYEPPVLEVAVPPTINAGPEVAPTPIDHVSPEATTTPDITIAPNTITPAAVPAEHSIASEPTPGTAVAVPAAESAPQAPQTPVAPDQPSGGPGRTQEAPTATLIRPGEIAVIHHPAETAAPTIAESAAPTLATTATPRTAEATTPAQHTETPTATRETTPAAEITAPATETSAPTAAETTTPVTVKTAAPAITPSQHFEAPRVPAEAANTRKEAPRPAQKTTMYESTAHIPTINVATEHHTPAAEIHAPVIEKPAPTAAHEISQPATHEAPATPQVQRESTRPTPQHESVPEPAQIVNRLQTTQQETTTATSRQETAPLISQPDIVIPVAERTTPDQTSTTQPVSTEPIAQSTTEPTIQFVPAKPATRTNTAPSGTIGITAPQPATQTATPALKTHTATPTRTLEFGQPEAHSGLLASYPTAPTDTTDDTDLTITIDAPAAAGRTPRRRAHATARSTA